MNELPPHDGAAEWFLLACLVIKPELIPGIASELFYQEETRRVLLKLQAFHLEKHECLSDPWKTEVEIGRQLESHYFEPLSRAVVELPSPEGWSYWREILEDLSQARRILGLTGKIRQASDSLRNGDHSVLEELRKEMDRIQTSVSDWHTGEDLKSLAPKVLDEFERMFNSKGALKGYSTGLRNIDRASDGLQNGRMYVLAGRPGEGKSSLCLQMAYEVASEGHPVLYVSLEMGAQELAQRLTACLSRVPSSNFSSGTASEDDFKLCAGALSSFSKIPLTIIDSISSLRDIVACVNRSKASKGTSFLVVDYLQRVHVPGFKGNRNDLVTEISNAMKDLAMTLNIPVLCAAQLNRASTRENRPPNLSDLRDSGALEQDADFVGILHSDGGKNSKLLVAKNRSGELGAIGLEFRREITRFDCVM